VPPLLTSRVRAARPIRSRSRYQPVPCRATDAASQALFDPLWGLNDPSAGAWFAQQALQLAQDASPALPSLP